MTLTSPALESNGWILDGIPPTDLDRRVAETRERMRAESVGLLLAYADCWRVSNVSYFADFRALDGIYEHASALFCLPLEADPVLLVGGTMIDYGRSVSRFRVEQFSDLRTVLDELTPSDGSVAIAGRYIMAAWLSDALAEQFGERLVATELLAVQKSKKSAWEVAQLSEAARLGDVGMEAIRDQMQTHGSTSERDLARIAAQAMIREGADGIGMNSMIQSGPRSVFSLAHPSDRMVVDGDMVMTDFGPRYRSYVADGGRGFTFGKVTDRQQEIVDASAFAVEAGFDAIGIGVPASAVNGAIQFALRDRGFERFSSEARGHGTGHGTGMDPEEELPWIRPDSDVLLEADMVFTIKATILVPGSGGLRTERIIWMSPDGPVALDQFPLRNHW